MMDENGSTAGQGGGARAESSEQPNARSEIQKRQPKSSHPAAEIYQLMQGKAFEVLVATIAANGLQEDIALYNGPDPEHIGKILDGRNRERGCIAAGVEPRYKQVVTDDPLTYVLVSNLRRHPSIKERRAACANAMKLAPDRSDRQLAEFTGLNGHTVASIRKELEVTGIIPRVTARTGADNKVRQLPKADGEAPNAEDANRASCTVGDVRPGSAAAAAGFQPGDLVLTIDGRPVESFQDIQQIISTSAGETLVFEVDRGGVKVTLKAPRLTEEEERAEAEADEAEAKAKTNRAFCAVEPGETETSAHAATPAELFGAILTGLKTSHDETPGDETPGDETPGDETPGDETPGDETPGDETPGDKPLPEVQTYLAFRNKLLPDELAAYDEFSVNVVNKIRAVKLSRDERATIMAMRVRQLLGRKPAPVLAAANGDVEKLREAKYTLERQCLALESQIAELKAEVAGLKAALNKDHEAFIDAEFERIDAKYERLDPSKQPQGKSQQPHRKSKRGRS